jgi:hypothetical protein
MKLALLLGMILSLHAHSKSYLGANYGYAMYSSDALKEYKVAPKGFTYGGFLGYGKEFVGMELFFQDLKTAGKIKHDGGNYDINTNAQAMGVALRFSFQSFYLRMGLARYNLDQSLDIEDPIVRGAADEIYEIHDKGTKENGAMFGVGLHQKFGGIRTFIDYTRYQIYGIGLYDTMSVGFSFAIPENLFSNGRY